MPRSTRTPTVLIASVATALLLASCSSSGGFSSNEAGGGAVPEPGRVLPGEPLPDGSEPDIGAGGAEDEGTDAGREVIVTAWVSLSDADPLEVADEIEEIAEAAGGRVDQRTDSPAGATDPASASLVLRIPTNDLDAAMDEIADAATVVSSALDRRDVTSTVTDITARIGALEASIDRLLELLDGATSTSDLISIESELTTRQAERDSLVAQQQSLVEQVAFSTVTVDVGVPEEVGGAGPGDFWGGLVLGFRSLGAFLGGALVVVGVLVPWLLLAAAVAALVWWLRRRRRGRGPRSSGRAERPVSPTRPSAEPQSSSGVADGAAGWPAGGDSRIPPRPPLPGTTAPEPGPTVAVAAPAVAPSPAAPPEDPAAARAAAAPADAAPADAAPAAVSPSTASTSTAARKPAARKPAARKPATRKPAARKPPARKPPTTPKDEL